MEKWLKEKEERSREDIVRHFQFKWLSEIEELLCEEGDLKFSGSGRRACEDKSGDEDGVISEDVEK